VTIAAGTEVVILLGDSNRNASGTPVVTVSQGGSDVRLENENRGNVVLPFLFCIFVDCRHLLPVDRSCPSLLGPSSGVLHI